MSKEINVKLPENVKLRPLDPNCQKSGHLCALFNGQKACLIPIVEETKEGLVIFDIKPCVKTGKKGLEIEE